jgi:Leucine-rich repeat (LRR) protein
VSFSYSVCLPFKGSLFYFIFRGLYGCEVSNLVIDSTTVRIANVLGTHIEGSSNLEVEYVWLKESRLTHLPHFDAQVFFPNIQKYLITGSHLRYVKREDFAGMPKLQTIYLDDNDIEELPEDLLYDLSGLVDFFVEKNKLRSLPTYLFNHATMFQRFRAANNSIEEMPRDFFKNNNILKIVTMDNNKLQRIQIDFRPYKNLKKLDLLNNTCINTNFNDWRKHKSVPIVQDEINKSCR